MHILVTGGAGFIGSHLTDKLLEQGHRVRILDALVDQVHASRRERPRYLATNAELIVASLNDPDAVMKALNGIDAIVHLAAAVGVGQSMYRIVEYCSSNIMGTANLLQLLVERKQRLRSLIVASSMSVYGEGKYVDRIGNPAVCEGRRDVDMQAARYEPCDNAGHPLQAVPTDELKALRPSSVYAVNKRDQEELCLAVGQAYGIPTTALRFFNVYGSRQALNNPYTGVAAIFCSRLMNNEPPVLFEDGHQRRDFIHVSDVASAIALASEKALDSEVLNIGSGHSISVLEIAETLAKALGKSIVPLVLRKFRRGDVRHCFADIKKAKQLLGWAPRYRFDEGVEELINWVGAQRVAEDHVIGALTELDGRGLVR